MKQKRIGVLLILIILFGAFLRLYRLNHLATFRGDQAIELLSTQRILQGKFTLIGIKTSVSEVRNGAIMYYINAPFLYLLNYDPIAGGVVQSLLSLATIVVVFYIGKKFENPQVGLIAAFFVATSSLLVLFSRQNLLAFSPLFFSSLSLFLFLLITKRFTIHLSLFLGILLGVALQVHYSSIAMIFSALILPLLFLPKKIFLRYYLSLFLGILIGFLPMIIFEFRHNFFNSHMLFQFLTHKKAISDSGFNFSKYVIDVTGKLFFGGNFLLAILFILFLIGAIIKYRRKINIPPKIYILQIFSTLIFIILFVREMVPHYLISAFSPIILLLSSLLYDITTSLEKRRQYPLLFIVMIGFLIVNYSSYGLSDNHGWTMTEGWTLSGTKKAARLIAQNVQTAQYNVVMLVDAENQALPLRYFLEIWGKPPLGVEHYDKADELYVVVAPAVELAKVNLFEINSFGAYQIASRWSIQNGFYLYKLLKRAV